MRTAIAAPALALLCACAGGYTPGPTLPGDGNGIPVGGNNTDGGNNDTGDAGDGGGTDGGDAGCTALSLPTTQIIDACVSPNGVSVIGSVSETNCFATITGPPIGSCIGKISGVSDAFDGGCGSYSPCTSPKLPGTIICTIPGMTTSCQITVCNGDC
jgi:hypothetical protein